MDRDHRKLEIFVTADGLVLDVYRATAPLATSERYGLQAQIRRAAVSVATNIVEGGSRPTTAEYCRFLDLSLGSANETGHLLDLACRLALLDRKDSEPIVLGYSE